MSKSFLLLSILSLLLSQGMSAPAHPSRRSDTLELPCRQKAEQLLDEVLGFMEKNYYHKDQVFWPTLASRARQRLEAADNCDDAYSSISWCFKELGEPHSFIMPPDKTARYTGEDAGPTAPADLSGLVGEIKGEWLQDSIAYLTIPWVSSTDSLVCERIADSLQSVIARLDSRNISRWIIDLRKNSGGNCWPMLAGIGPLLGDGVYGYFVASGEKIPITYHDGSAFQGRHVLCRVSDDHGYRTRSACKSIVVLTGSGTVSAGEIVALAFKGREQTCLLGQPTAGLTTANATYSLSDRSMLVLTVCQEADHTGRVYEGSIQPDKLVGADPADSSPDDPARAAALAWLQRK
ncbi:MAG TPA: S41 family peptidase [Puia sp.]|nr:S41 family peptidase [Puia sp.]